MIISVREARPDDAVELLSYLHRVLAEPGINLINTPEEFKLSVEEEARFLADMAGAVNSLYLVAEHEGVIIRQVILLGGKRRSIRHATTLGITIAKEWRGQGVGRRLMDEAIAYARSSGVIKRIELQVFVRNQPAIHLYEQCGFETEGVLRRAVYRDDEYLDEYVMALLLD
jgi:putative acetyltransferase